MVFEAMLNRVNYLRANGHPGMTLRQYLSGSGARFYGPIKHGLITENYLRKAVDPYRGPHGIDAEIDEPLAGSNYVKGYADQGGPGDPNYGKSKVFYNKEGFGDFGGSSKYRLQQQRAVLDRALKDETAKQQVEGSGNVKIEVKPDPTKPRSPVFKDVSIERPKQMTPAGEGNKFGEASLNSSGAV
jgi:hypothetical protein